jgi:hypothetical protein
MIRLTLAAAGLAIVFFAEVACSQEDGSMSGDWRVHREGEQWRGGVHDEPEGVRMRWTFPWRTDAGPPNTLAFERDLTVPDANTVSLSFLWTDDFAGPTRGYHVLQASINGTVIWEQDVAAGGSQPERVNVDVSAQCRGRERIRVRLAAVTRKRVTNFGVVIQVKAPELVAGTGVSGERPYLPVPAEIALEALPPAGADWTERAVVLQPWGRTQYEAMYDCGDLPVRLAREYGFNTMIVLPPGAHAYTAPPECRLSEAAFDAALSAYRAAGFRVLLYSSIMHIGHSRAWEEGIIEREHPEWAQRDAEGGTINRYGHPWLCPSTGALDYAIEYTLGIVQRYGAAGVMLDNNQFMSTQHGGPTCYCDACRRRFREYVSQRFGEQVESRFGVSAELIDIPVFPGELMNVWIHWRNRVWADANERFRHALRAVNPDLVFFANTQYGHADWDLATDHQYVHEDVMLSESRGLDSLGMSAKLTLGLALAQGRPVWNYIGTFREDDFRRLRPPRVVSSITAPALALQVCPWIVYYGFDEDNTADAPSRAALRALLDFRRDHLDLCVGMQPWGSVGILFDLRSRNYVGAPLIPECVKLLLCSGVVARGIRSRGLSAVDLDGIRILAASNAACVSDAEARILKDWMQKGGTVVATVDFATRDELGQLRSGRAVAETSGAGLILVDQPDQVAEAVLEQCNARFADDAGRSDHNLEFRAYRNQNGRGVVHIVNHGDPLPASVTVTVPPAFAGTSRSARFLQPGEKAPMAVRIQNAGTQRQITLPELDVFGVLVLE